MGAISSGAIMYESSSPSGAVTTASGLSFAAREWPGSEVRARVGRGCRDHCVDQRHSSGNTLPKNVLTMVEGGEGSEKGDVSITRNF